jgi:hypothetical protein
MNSKDKKIIYKAFQSEDLTVKSVSKDKKVEWKRVLDVTRHNVTNKNQFRISIGNASCTATEDHSLFKDSGFEIQETKTGDFKVGENIVCVEDEKVINKKVLSNLQVPPQRYMYDLTVEDNENFVLKSGILAHNTFRPPATEKFMQAQTRVFGYIWEDEELYEYLLMAVNELNSSPPVTGVTIDNLPDRWTTNVLLRAGAFACGAVTISWIVNEFDYSISGISLSIDKSSKYESMKNNFLQEWEKSRELIKRSIKITKGLNQPRYGIGISSALGPYSRPGTQSRRNFISGFRGGWA